MLIIGTIEARMGSTRLPGKTLMDVFRGMTLLELIVNRFKMARLVDTVYVATTIKKTDDPIAIWCDKNNVNCHRGSEDDVLDRVAGIAVKTNADAIVQMGADSAYLDFELVDQMVGIYLSNDCDYACNDLELTYPLGVYAHVVNAARLIGLNRRTDLSEQDREDVVRYIFEHPDEYRLKNIVAPAELAFPNLRLTIDYPEDMRLLREILDRFGGYGFTTSDILALYRKEPFLFDGTKHLVQRSAPFLKAATHG
jgi:spore coat polysaccharide biosynthesis protein SpsF (cytidylyltransferase family)